MISFASDWIAIYITNDIQNELVSSLNGILNYEENDLTEHKSYTNIWVDA